MNSWRNSITVWFLVIVMSGATLAQDGAILYGSQGVALNGKPIPATVAVLSGDKVETATAPAQIVKAGTTVQVGSNTSLQYGSPLELGCGSILLDGDLVVQTSATRIIPSGKAKFEVANRGGNLLISVKSGSVSLQDGEIVGPGQSTMKTGTAGCQVPNPAPAASAKGNGKLIGIIGAGAAAGVVGGVMAGRDKGSVSPSRP